MDYIDDEEDELQMMLEGHCSGDEQLLTTSIKKQQVKTNDTKLKLNANQRRKRAFSDDEKSQAEEDNQFDAIFDFKNDKFLDPSGENALNLEEIDQNSNENFFDNDESKSKEKQDSEKKKRRIVNRNPRVVLNVDRLKYKEGIVQLPELFKKVKFRGKGFEKDDLNIMMSTYERWAHRLMPSFQFDDFIEKAEILCKKAVMKTFLTKIRNDMTLDLRNVAGERAPELIDKEEDLSNCEPFEPISSFVDKNFEFSSDEEDLLNNINEDGTITNVNDLALKDEINFEFKTNSNKIDWFESDDEEVLKDLNEDIKFKNEQEKVSTKSELINKEEKDKPYDLLNENMHTKENLIFDSIKKINNEKMNADENNYDNEKPKKLTCNLLVENNEKQLETEKKLSSLDLGLSEIKKNSQEQSNGEFISEDEFLSLLNN